MTDRRPTQPDGLALVYQLQDIILNYLNWRLPAFCNHYA